MHFIDKWERKVGKYAVKRLIIYILMAYAIGYAILAYSSMTTNDIYSLLEMNPEMIISHFQIWRIFTWVFTVPQSLDMGPTSLFSASNLISFIFVLFMFYFYYWIGTTLENYWGAFRYNLYIFTGLILMTVTPILLYLITKPLAMVLPTVSQPINVGASTYYLNLTSFLAFATIFPDQQVYLFMFIPVKMKWLAIVDAVFLGISFFRCLFMALIFAAQGNVDYFNLFLGSAIMIVVSVLNFVIFFFVYRKSKFGTFKQQQARNAYKRKVKTAARPRYSNPTNSAKERRNPSGATGSRHYCAVCGRTEVTNPELQFRFCSKCVGNLEYCSDHLFSHAHRKI